MNLDQVKYRLSLNDIELLKDKIEVVNYSSILYSLSELNQAFEDYMDLIDSYENFCERKEDGSAWYFCEFNLCDNILYKAGIIVHITLYNSK